MKISPVSSSSTLPGIDTQTRPTIRMQTDVTPGAKNPPDVQELSIPDDSEEKPTATIEATEPLSPQFAALAKQRRALQQERRAFEDAKKAQAASSQGSDQVALTRIKSEPLSVLTEAGVTYEQLTEAILANQGNPEIHNLKAELTALKEGIDKKFVDKETQAEQQVLAEMRREAERECAQGDDFELVRETKSVPQVMKLIELTYRKTGEVLDVKEALKLVEEELFKRNQKLVTTKKLQGLFNKPAEPLQPQPRAQGMRTLTNKDTASVPLDRKQRALARFWGQPIKG